MFLTLPNNNVSSFEACWEIKWFCKDVFILRAIFSGRKITRFRTYLLASVGECSPDGTWAVRKHDFLQIVSGVRTRCFRYFGCLFGGRLSNVNVDEKRIPTIEPRKTVFLAVHFERVFWKNWNFLRVLTRGRHRTGTRVGSRRTLR